MHFETAPLLVINVSDDNVNQRIKRYCVNFVRVSHTTTDAIFPLGGLIICRSLVQDIPTSAAPKRQCIP